MKLYKNNYEVFQNYNQCLNYYNNDNYITESYENHIYIINYIII